MLIVDNITDNKFSFTYNPIIENIIFTDKIVLEMSLDIKSNHSRYTEENIFYAVFELEDICRNFKRSFSLTFPTKHGNQELPNTKNHFSYKLFLVNDYKSPFSWQDTKNALDNNEKYLIEEGILYQNRLDTESIDSVYK